MQKNFCYEILIVKLSKIAFSKSCDTAFILKLEITLEYRV